MGNITTETNKSGKYLQLTLRLMRIKQKIKNTQKKSYRPFPKSSDKLILTNLLHTQPGSSHYNR